MNYSDNNKKNQVQRAGVGYTIGNYLLKGLSFFSIPIFVRMMPTADYGIYSTYMAYESILTIIVGLAIHTSFKNAKYRYETKLNAYISSCLLLLIINFFVLCSAIFIFHNFLKNVLQFSLLIFILMMMQSLGSAVITCFNSFISIFYKFKYYILIAAVNAIGNIFLSIVLMKSLFKKNVASGRILGTAFPIIILSLFIIVWWFRKEKPKVSKEYWKFALRYSIPIIPHGISQVILNQFDRIMINKIVGATETGIYSFAYNIYSIVFVTITSLETVWSTWFYERMNAKDLRAIKKKGDKFAYGIFLFCSIILLLSPEIIKILGTQEYYEAVDSVVPIVIGGYFAFLYFLPCQIEYFYGKTIFIAIGSLAAAAINVLLNAFFIPIYGYVAAAYTTLLSYVLYFVFHYIIAIYIQKKCIYNTKKIFIYCFVLSLVGVTVLISQHELVLRVFIAIIFGIITLIFLYKEIIKTNGEKNVHEKTFIKGNSN